MAGSSDKIRVLNDRFRQGDPSIPGHVYMTNGIQELTKDDPTELAALFIAVREFDEFDRGNDPHSEHDFGAFQFKNEKLFWKVDYYTPDLQHGSEDPSDLTITLRVLTIMLAEEY